MSRWNQKFKEHPIHKTIEEIYAFLNVKFDNDDADRESEKRRLLKFVNFFEKTIKALDGELIPYDLLDGINSDIRHGDIHLNLSEYSRTGQGQYLKYVNDLLDSLFEKISQLVAIAKRSDITEPLEELEKSLNGLSATVSTKKSELEKDFHQASSILNEQNERLEKLSKTISTKQQEAEELLTAWKEQHSSDQSKRIEEFTKDQKAREDTLLTWKKEVEQDAQTHLQTLIDNSSKRLTELEKNFHQASSILNEQNKRLEKLSTTISTKQQETEELLTTWEEQHSSDQSKRSEEFTKDQKAREDTFLIWKKEFGQDAKTHIQTLINNSNKQLAEGQKGFDDKISSLIESAKSKHLAILELHELVAGDSVASGYVKSAEKEEKQANFWRWATILFISLTAGWIGYAYITDTGIGTSGEILWGKILKSFSLTSVLLFGAAYSARQSNFHRQSEAKARWFALEVKAIDPLIASLSEEHQKDIKYKVSDRLFTQQTDAAEKGASSMDKSTFKTMVKAVIDILNANK